MCNNAIIVDFCNKLTTIIYNKYVFLKKEEKFCIFPLFSFLE